VLGGELTPLSLLGFIKEELRVQAPPELVVLIDALTTNGQFNGFHGTLGRPGTTENGEITGTGGEARRSNKFNIHITDQITITGDSHGDTAVVGRRTVHSLFDVFHREVSVALVDRLEEGNFWVTSQVDVLSTVRNQLHETTSHFFCTIYQDFFFG